jgi:ABC-type multidrug transport system ATPase subunit
MAVSFALSEVLLSRAGLSPNIEIYDEPTKGLSPNGIADLLEHLRDRALELGRAVFVVDHHSFDRGLFDGTLMITKGKKGSSAKWLS